MAASMKRCAFLGLASCQVAISIRLTLDDALLDPVDGEDHAAEILQMATQSDDAVEKMSCSDFIMDMTYLLERISTTFRENKLSESSQDDKAFRQGAMVLAVSEGAHRKHCLSTMFQSRTVQEKIEAILIENVDNAPATNGLTAQNSFSFCKNGEQGCRHSYESMVLWQHALLALNDTALFYNPLLSSDVSKAPECPPECSWCSTDHKSMYKAKEAFSFKCVLKERNTPPQTKHGVTCSAPSMRFSIPWQRKVWCEVQDWKIRVVRQNKVAALISCSLHLLNPRAHHSRENGEYSTEVKDAHKICLKVGEGFVVTDVDHDKFTRVLVNASTTNRTEELLMNIIKNLGIQAGLAELIRVSAEAGKDGDGSEPKTNTATRVIDVFHRSGEFPTEGGDYFPEPLPTPNYEVCALPPRGDLIGGAFSLLFRTALNILLMPFALVLSIPAAVMTFFSVFLMGPEGKGWFLTGAIWLTAIVASPVLLAGALALQAPAAWAGVGRITRTGDYDCDPAMEHDTLRYGEEPMCVRGMYRNRRMYVSRANRCLVLTCAARYNYDLVIETVDLDYECL